MRWLCVQNCLDKNNILSITVFAVVPVDWIFFKHLEVCPGHLSFEIIFGLHPFSPSQMQIDLISLVDNRNKTEKLRFFLLFFFKKRKTASTNLSHSTTKEGS